MTAQSKQNPFSFVTANGMFCTPWSEAVISVHALNVLSQQLDNPDLLSKPRLAISALLEACRHLPTEKTYSQTQKNDVPANELVPSRYQPDRYPFTGCEKLHHIIMTVQKTISKHNTTSAYAYPHQDAGRPVGNGMTGCPT